ncbi:hypothetical protein RB195_001887 [Necator americanus]|uniref:Uncharacterized protein n=1 Tax=Necator americanus TaxID=51031 RepID=A0ABR1DGE5_NECAM
MVLLKVVNNLEYQQLSIVHLHDRIYFEKGGMSAVNICWNPSKKAAFARPQTGVREWVVGLVSDEMS